jgi:hypothetical protein
MRYSKLFLAFALAFGLALPATASVPRARNAHPRTFHLKRVARVHASHIHHAHLSRQARAALKTQTVSATETIPAVPLRTAHFAIPPLRGSHESLVRQNEKTEAEGLERIADDTQLDQMRFHKELIAVPVSAMLRVNEGLPMNRRYCRPWTGKFLADLARVHYSRFRRPLQVNSAVRTVAFQRALIEINGNAAPAEGDIASPHLTGAAIDIGKKGLSISEVAWMRAYLLPLQSAGKIDVEEEFYQACFHITVYKNYAPAALPKALPRRRHVAGTMLAARMR